VLFRTQLERMRHQEAPVIRSALIALILCLTWALPALEGGDPPVREPGGALPNELPEDFRSRLPDRANLAPGHDLLQPEGHEEGDPALPPSAGLEVPDSGMSGVAGCGPVRPAFP
jgi:hypothetical protein